MESGYMHWNAQEKPVQFFPQRRKRFVVAMLIASCLFLLTPMVAAQNETSQSHEQPPEHQPDSRRIEFSLEWLDHVQDGFEGAVDGTARWFDQFFGAEQAFDGSEGARGRISLRPEWSEYDGLKIRSNLRIQFTLPNTEARFSALIGRVDFDDFASGDSGSQRGSVIRQESGDEEWIIGLGFNPQQGETNRFSLSAGLRGGLRADPYVQSRYLYQYRLSDASQIRSRSSLFWRDSDGFGANQRIDLENSPHPEWLNRLRLDATRAERIRGYRWNASIASYHLYAPEKAMASEFFWRGETKQEVPMRDFGFRVIHRRSWLREWVFLETYAGLHWPRDTLSEPRTGSYLVGIELEMWFGD